MSCGVYQIKNTINGKIYVGSSKEIEERWKRHLKDLQDGRHHNIKLQRAFNKYGEAAFVFEIIEITDPNYLLIREQSYLDNNKNGYNIGLHASGGDNLTNNPNREEIIKRMTESVNKRYAAMSPEEREQHSQKMIGEGNPNFGKRWNDDLRKKVGKIVRARFEERPELKTIASKTIKNLWKNEEYRAAQIERAKSRTGDKNTFFGKQHTEATKEKLRIKNTGKKLSDATKSLLSEISKDYYNSEEGKIQKKKQSQKMSGANHFLYGVGHTKESKEKMSKSRKEKWANITKEEMLKLSTIKVIKSGNDLYLGLKLASKYLHISDCALTFRCKSTNPKWKEFQFVEKASLTPEQIDNLIWRHTAISALIDG